MGAGRGGAASSHGSARWNEPVARRHTKAELTHLDRRGQVRMVDVGGKPPTARKATASAVVQIRKAILDRLLDDELPKGDALATARVAGIFAAKRTSDWIPLCHPLSLSSVAVGFERTAPGQLTITCTARTTAQTGVEMEAMTGVTAAALTVYDMVKSADRSATIGPVRLERKTGGKSGAYVRRRA